MVAMDFLCTWMDYWICKFIVLDNYVYNKQIY